MLMIRDRDRDRDRDSPPLLPLSALRAGVGLDID